MKARKPSLPAILALLLMVPNLIAQSGKTYFVRPGGGADRTVANGLTDVDCSAATGANCAFGSPTLVAWPGNGYNIDGPSWILQSGDTVVIHAGKYPCGYAGSGFGNYGGAAVPGNPFGPCLPAVPAGTTWRGDGSGTTQIFGRYGANAIFEVNVPDVTISGLELTDHGQCSRVGTAPDCNVSPSAPLSDFAQNGILTGTGTSNLTLTDLNCHGFTGGCIIGPLGGPVHVKNVRMAYNGGAGWDFDNGSHTPSINNASVDASGLIVEWNGCNEEYPVVHKYPALSCYDDNHGGYGDGVGTPDTPLNFSCDQCIFRYNTQDGLDLLHTSGSIISVTHSASYGNMGQQIKLGSMAKWNFSDNTITANCRRLSMAVGDTPAGFNANLSDFCRASNEAIALAIQDGGSYTWVNNSIFTYDATTYDISCGVGQTCATADITFQNNLHVAYPVSSDGTLPGIFYFNNVTPNTFAASDHNIYFQMRSCPTETGSKCVDPKLAAEPSTLTDETTLDTVDMHLTSASPAAGAGAALTSITDDYAGVTRAVPYDIGAYALGSTPPPPPPVGIAAYSGTINPAAITIPAQTINVPVPGQTISVPVPASIVVVPAQTVKVKGQNVTIGGYSITVPASTVTYTIAPSSVTGAVPAKTVTPAPIGINCPVVNNAVTCTTK